MASRYQIRPMTQEDLSRVLAWRNSERVRSCMFSDQPIVLMDHLAWWERARANTLAKHLIFEVDGMPMGVVNFTGIDRQDGRCDWGFYLGESNAPKGTGTFMGVLALDHAFGALGIRKVCAEVIGFNVASLGYHRKLGFKEEGRRVRHRLRADRLEDVVLFAMFAEDWPDARKQLQESHLEVRGERK